MMIKLIQGLSSLKADNPVNFKIKSEYSVYPDQTRVYKNEIGALLCLFAGGSCAVTSGFEKEELNSFLSFVLPNEIFCDEKTAEDICLPSYEKNTVAVLEFNGKKEHDFESRDLSSREAYDFFDSHEDFSLPPYEYFATDYCKRKNGGALIARAIKDKSAAMAFVCENAAFLHGVVSKEKGFGSAALCELLYILQSKTVFAAANEKVVPFYIKNGFKRIDNTVYFIKKR